MFWYQLKVIVTFSRNITFFYYLIPHLKKLKTTIFQNLRPDDTSTGLIKYSKNCAAEYMQYTLSLVCEYTSHFHLFKQLFKTFSQSLSRWEYKYSSWGPCFLKIFDLFFT